jgi:hypothetical protein
MPPEVPRKPLHATLAGTPGERRWNRLKPPPCPVCGHDATRVTLRSDYVLYFRCEHCAGVWSTPKPGHEEYGT